MKMKLLSLIAGMTLLGSAVAANASSYVVTLEQEGANVVATGSGTIDLTGLTLDVAGENEVPGLNPTYPAGTIGGAIITGTPGASDDRYIVTTTTFFGPSNFGTGGGINADTGSGDIVGVLGGEFIVPAGYGGTANLSDEATYDNATFASLGLTPGTYVYNWGTGADQRFTLDIVATTPLPAALPLFAGGLGMVGFLARRKKQKALAAA